MGGSVHDDDTVRAIPSTGHRDVHRSLPGAVPHYRAMVGLDMKGSTNGTNPQRGVSRAVMYDLLERTIRESGISDQHRDELMDRGDGVFTYLRPVDEVPKSLLISTVIPTLDRLLREHNERHPEEIVRMRAVVHAGEIHNDGRGWFGEALDLACRLLDAPGLRRRFDQTDADLILVVSNDFYQSIVRHYNGVQNFERVVRVRVGHVIHWGWVTVPRTDAPKQLCGITDLGSRRPPQAAGGSAGE